MSTTGEKVKKAVKFLQCWINEYDWSSQFLPGMCPDITPQLCFSGGKDSVLLRFLCDSAKISYQPVYSVTTIDPPPLIKFIKKHHADVVWSRPQVNFFKRMETKGFPLRQRRWCCQEYKENTSFSLLKLIGVRAAESARRTKQWKLVNRWNGGEKIVFCPALAFLDSEVWEVIRAEGLPYCEMYDCGWHRLGCIGCPMARPKERRRDLDAFPGFERLYRRSFARNWELRAGTRSQSGKEWFGSRKFKSSDELFEWWLKDISSPKDLLKSGFELEDIEDDNCQSLFDFAESCDLGMF